MSVRGLPYLKGYDRRHADAMRLIDHRLNDL